MALSSDAREFLAKSLFGQTTLTPFDVNEYTIHICTSISLGSSYSQVTTASLGSTLIADTTAAIASAFTWDSSLNVGGSSSDTGAIKNASTIQVTATAGGTATHFAIVESSESAVVLVQAFTNPSNYVMSIGDKIAFGAGSIQIEIE